VVSQKVEWAGGTKVDRMRRWDAKIVKMYMYIFDCNKNKLVKFCTLVQSGLVSTSIVVAIVIIVVKIIYLPLPTMNASNLRLVVVSNTWVN